MNEYILSKMAEITTCYELITIYYKVHFYSNFVQRLVFVGDHILNCYINVNISHTNVPVLRCHKENLFCQRDRISCLFQVLILFLGNDNPYYDINMKMLQLHLACSVHHLPSLWNNLLGYCTSTDIILANNMVLISTP